MQQNSKTNRKYQDRNMQNLQRKPAENHNRSKPKKSLDFLDITMDSRTGEHKPYMHTSAHLYIYTTKATTHQTLSKTSKKASTEDDQTYHPMKNYSKMLSHLTKTPSKKKYIYIYKLEYNQRPQAIYTNKTGDCLFVCLFVCWFVCLSVRLWTAKPQGLTG